jgi:Family of unknown function (DUF5632)/Family of unknown function (DUF5631)
MTVPDYPPGAYSAMLVGAQWVSITSVTALSNAIANRGTIQTNFSQLHDTLQNAITTTLVGQEGITADAIRDAFRQGADQAAKVAEKNGGYKKALQDALDSVQQLRHKLTNIANDGNKQINDELQSKDDLEIKVAKIAKIIADCQRQANQAAADCAFSIIGAGQGVLDAQGTGQSFFGLSRDAGIDTNQQPDLKAIQDQVRGKLSQPSSQSLTGAKPPTAPGTPADPMADAPRAAPPAPPAPAPAAAGPMADAPRAAPPAPAAPVSAPVSPMADAPRAAPPAPLAPARVGGAGGVPAQMSALLPPPMSGTPMGGIPPAWGPNAPNVPPGLNPGAPTAAPTAPGAPGLTGGPVQATAPQVPPTAPTAPTIPATAGAPVTVGDAPPPTPQAPATPAVPSSAAYTSDPLSTMMSGPAPAPYAVPPEPAGPLPAYGSDLRPPIVASPAAPPIVPSAPSAPISQSLSAAPGSAPVHPSAGGAGVGQPTAVARQPTAVPTPAQTPPGVGAQSVLATAGGALAGAISADATERTRLQRLLAAVARQEPRLAWAIGDRSDETTVLVTDLASGWIPPGIEIPAAVTLLEPARRRGDIETMLGEVKLAAGYVPGDYRPDPDADEPVPSSPRPRHAPEVEELSWQLSQATHWRDGLPRLAHTLARAASRGTGVLESEAEQLHEALTTLADRVLDRYPDAVDADQVGNWQLLAAIEALVAGDKGAANYHLAWFLACNTAVPERVAP